MDLYINLALGILIGYLLGGILPGYFLGRALKGIDIREYGLGNAGATNTFRVVGSIPGILTGFFDLIKGILAMGIVHYFLNPPLFIVYLAGIFAIIGHIFPFYLQFRGGRGMASAVGILAFFLFLSHQNQWLGWQDFTTLLLVSLIFFFITRKKAERRSAIPGIAAASLIFIFIFLKFPLNITTVFLATVTAFIWGFSIYLLKRDQKFLSILEEGKKNEDLTSWRTFLRPLAIIFPVLLFFFGKEPVLISTGAATLLLIFLGLLGIRFKRKKGEGIFSSITYFFLAIFLACLIFEESIAAVSISFLIVGDLSAKIFHILYGQKKFFHKFLEGALACFATSLAIGYVFWHFVDLSFPILFIGAAAAAFIESYLTKLDDNFTIPLFSG